MAAGCGKLSGKVAGNHMKTMEQPCFSILIPVYNVEKYLRQCVESVLGQTYTDYEVILIDDG